MDENQPINIITMDSSLAPLKERFNTNVGTIRFLALFPLHALYDVTRVPVRYMRMFLKSILTQISALQLYGFPFLIKIHLTQRSHL